MFYPEVFPAEGEFLSPAATLQVEAATVYLLVSAHKAFLTQHREDLREEILHELTTFGIVPPGTTMETGARALLTANAPSIRRLADDLGRPRRESDWQLMTPDWRAVSSHLGAEVCDEWRERLAEWEAEGRANVARMSDEALALQS